LQKGCVEGRLAELSAGQAEDVPISKEDRMSAADLLINAYAVMILTGLLFLLLVAPLKDKNKND
jgi:hypothetical protein